MPRLQVLPSRHNLVTFCFLLGEVFPISIMFLLVIDIYEDMEKKISGDSLVTVFFRVSEA